MAEPEETKAADAIIGGAMKGPALGGGGKSIIWLSLLVVTVAICAAGGFYAGRVMKTAQASEAETGSDADPALAVSTLSDGSGLYRYYDLEPITINLDEPRLARYVRATITLAFDAKQESEVLRQVEKRLPELKNWLAVYLAGRTLDEVRGAQSLNRVRREICEAFNEQIWPQQPPRIHHVLLKEFAVQ
ncbi:MAG: flagellar basal body-associated FliL family protein [Phycisphaerae bacterium]|nr:flagellar basal body-associated FliL family protein [Phycisphaerae bacterium]